MDDRVFPFGGVKSLQQFFEYGFALDFAYAQEVGPFSVIEPFDDSRQLIEFAAGGARLAFSHVVTISTVVDGIGQQARQG